MDIAVFEIAPELHAVQDVGVVGTHVHAKLTIEAVYLFEKLQVSDYCFVSLTKLILF